MMKTRLQRTELLRAARALSTPKCTATMFLVALLAILTYPTKTWAQEPIAKIGATPYESLQEAFNAAADGSTVTLLANVDLGESTIDIWTDEGERNLTFDLNSFSLTGTNVVLNVRYGVNVTVKRGTVGGPDADNLCYVPIHIIGGKVNIEDLTINNCKYAIYNEEDWIDDETSVAGELTIGSGVNISATVVCIGDYQGKLTLTALPILSWGEDGCGIILGESNVINFAGEGITALPEGFKPIMICAYSELPILITDGYADHVKSGSEVIDPDKVFVGENENLSLVLYDGEAMMTYGGIQKVSVTKGNEVKQYLSLQTAFDEATDGSTITLLDNADLGETLIDIKADGGERNLTFDLNGCSLTGTDELFYVHSGVNLTVKGGTVGGPNADNVCDIAIRNIGGKVNVESLTISNCRTGILNDDGQLDEETRVAGELTIGSGVNISATETCIDNSEGKLTLTDLPILSWDEEGYGISLRVGYVINFAGEGITALPEGFKPIKIDAGGNLPCVITNGYADHMKSGSEVIDPAKVFVTDDDDISMVLYDGEAIMTEGGIQNVSVTKGDEVKQYLSLYTAFNEADDGSTITLLDNADLGEDLIEIWTNEGERNLTFDLSGFSLTGKNELLVVHHGVNLTVKGGTVGGADADNACDVAIQNLGGKLNIENLTISNCEYGIYNEEDWIDDETRVAGELTIGSGVNISATKGCIIHYNGKLTLTVLPILSWGEEGNGIFFGEGQVINFAGEGITALPEGFKPIMIYTYDDLPRVITDGYADHVKSGNEVIDPDKVFVGSYDGISIILYDGEAMITYGGIQKVSVTKGDEVKEYISLQSAFDEAADGSTITLLDDADLGEYVINIRADKGERNLTFDLNNFSLTGAEALLYVHSGVNLTVKGGTVGGVDADNVCYDAICNFGGKVNIENLTIRNCKCGICNTEDRIDDETRVAGEMTIGSGVNISTTGICIEHFKGELTLTALPILSWGEDYYGIILGEGQVISFTGEGISALPEGFKPIKIMTLGELPHVITNGYSTFFKNIDPTDVFDAFLFVYDEEEKEEDAIPVSITLEDGEVSAQEPIAKIGDTPYKSLQDAFDAAADGSTITLLDNTNLVEDMIDIKTDGGKRNLTFDLNGFSLTGTEELLYVHHGVNLTVKGGTISGPDADNPCNFAFRILGGKLKVENLTISNCRDGIYNEKEELDEKTSVTGELTIGSGVNISVTERCIGNYEGELTLTALPILSWGEEDYGIYLGEENVIHFAGEGITALPEGFKPIKLSVDGQLPRVITDGYADHVKNGSEVIDPAKVFVGENNDISLVLYDGEAIMTYVGGGIQKVSVTKGDEVKQYLSLHTAFDEADDGSTITLLDNANIGDMIDIFADKGERNLTFDLNSFSLTGKDQLLYVHSGVNLTVKGGTIGGVDADNACENAIRNIGGKMNIENLTISNCEFSICNEKEWLDDETSVTGELTIGSGVNISSTKICIDNNRGKLTLTALPILSCDEDFCDIYLREGDVINFAGEGITALPEGFKPIMIWADGESSCVITNGYSTFFKNINPADVFDVDNGDESIIVSITLEGGEVRATFIEKSDVNGDGKIDVADVVALTNAIMAGTKDLKYDINCDNQVNQDDVTALVDIILERNDKE